MSTVSEPKSDMWIGSGLLIFCAISAWLTLDIKSGMSSSVAGPSMVPWLMIGGTALLSLLLIFRAKAQAGGEEAKTISMPDAHTLLIMLAFVLLLVAYAIAFYPIGYIPATLVTFFVGLWLLGERRWLVFALFPVIMTLAVYYGFTELLSVWLP
ncbi:putative tricarboxylic transport membrane protein [Cohaesibacter marisflavi]|uniref:Putative tricarboxylic transport membrane protein n=1 Tax=Cohaesibacter marisflavi TaxID=655353 RepID=A0A1I5IBC4_9HYPH|nr:tripartite tricarboxylate transporter TctB family protein [Cohaesibacter marisflavi]SFO57823.1 putative tricarboxylic transport membrane protein [Cohaesibacter marisflavi]